MSAMGTGMLGNHMLGERVQFLDMPWLAQLCDDRKVTSSLRFLL